MSKFLACVIVATALAGGVALAGINEPIQIESQTQTIFESGQSFELSASGITVQVRFTEVSADRVTGVVTRTGGGTSGTFRITWVERGYTREIDLTITEPEKLFSLEGGDTDKKTGQQQG